MTKNATKEELERLEKEYKNELGPDHICYIYKITNLANGKMYIGLTTISIESRWKGHLHDSKNKKIKRPLYNAIRKYGVKKFTIECIEECALKVVQLREQYWIKYYNTFLDKSKGYNCTPGGELGLVTKEDEEMIIKAYKKFKTLQKVADELNVDPHRAKSILLKNGIEVKSAAEHQKEKGNTILQYDLSGNLLNTFQSRSEAGQWLIDNNFSKSKKPNDAGCLIRNILAQDIHEYKGYYWEYEEEYPQELKDKFLERQKNKRNYVPCPNCGNNKDPNSILCQKCRKIEYEKPGEEKGKLYKELRKRKEHNQNKRKRIPKQDMCPICGEAKSIKSKYCINCSNHKRYLDSIDELTNKISRVELKNLIRTKSFIEIGQMYNVSDNAIKKWCKKYNLPARKFDIEKYSDEDWEKETWNLENLQNATVSHKRIKPTREQLKKDLYYLTKSEITKKYDYPDRKDINKLAKEYNLCYQSNIISKLSPKEWEEEKWNNENFINYIKKERFKYKLPTRTELKKLVRKFGINYIAELYKVDFNNVVLWLDYFNLPTHAYEIKRYTDEEWENEIWSHDTPATINKGGQADE